MAGRVRVDGRPATKAGKFRRDGAALGSQRARPYVGRGGEKLEAALSAFFARRSGLRCLDVGASTGGFTDALLAHGAAHVTALDVGYGQLAASLRARSARNGRRTHELPFGAGGSARRTVRTRDDRCVVHLRRYAHRARARVFDGRRQRARADQAAVRGGARPSGRRRRRSRPRRASRDPARSSRCARAAAVVPVALAPSVLRRARPATSSSSRSMRRYGELPTTTRRSSLRSRSRSDDGAVRWHASQRFAWRRSGASAAR